MPKVCCTSGEKKKCREFSYTPAGKAAAKRYAAQCKESGGKARTSHVKPPMNSKSGGGESDGY